MRAPAGLPREAATYDGVAVADLAGQLGVPSVHSFERIGSALDAAHVIAPGAPSGTLVLADEQTAGRGRHGRRWASASGAGVWLALVERPNDARALDVLALRCGLYVAEALDAVAGARVAVKWPNDLFVHGRKLAGVLIETRWRGTAPDWLAIGFGLNVVAPPELDTAAGLPSGVTRIAVLERIVPALRRAAATTRHLGRDELARWDARDVARGRLVSAPAAGRVRGISPSGELLVTSTAGAVSRHCTGSVTFAEPLACF